MAEPPDGFTGLARPKAKSAGSKDHSRILITPQSRTNDAQVRPDGAKDRIVYFDEAVREAITDWRGRAPESPYVFSTLKGGPMTTTYARQFVKRAARKAGISEWERVSPHTFRHTCATELLRETGNLRLVQVALGHSSVSTKQRYTHIAAVDLERAMSLRPGLAESLDSETAVTA